MFEIDLKKLIKICDINSLQKEAKLIEHMFSYDNNIKMYDDPYIKFDYNASYIRTEHLLIEFIHPETHNSYFATEGYLAVISNMSVEAFFNKCVKPYTDIEDVESFKLLTML